MLAAAMTGLITMTMLTMRSIGNSLRAEISALRTETQASIESLHAETAAQFASVHTRIDHLDRDVQAIARTVFPE